jgi:hypothetical protein
MKLLLISQSTIRTTGGADMTSILGRGRCCDAGGARLRGKLCLARADGIPPALDRDARLVRKVQA